MEVYVIKKMQIKIKINGDRLVFGFILIGVSFFEFSTFYLTNNYLIPYQDTSLLRNLFSIGAFPITTGLLGLKEIFSGFNLPLRLESVFIILNELSSKNKQKAERVIVGKCSTCHRNHRVRVTAIKSEMNLTCKCGKINKIKIPVEQLIKYNDSENGSY